MDHQEANSI